METKRIWRRAGSVFATLLLLCMWLPAQAVDGGPFELDGDAVESSADDWETLFDGSPNSATSFTGIVSDSVAEDGQDDFFTGGGSKTPNLISDWKYKTAPPSEPPDKNNISHAYAANYIVATKQVVYFGADLLATNGDAELAFWFFQNKITQQNGSFDGEHANGDVYVAVKFSNGGTQANIAVFEWDDTCTKPPGNGPFPAGGCAADNLRVIVEEGPATCGGGGGDVACAISNATSEEPSPWPYEPKSGTSGLFPPTAFFEGGINIFDIFGENKCFASFMATSGASTSFTSTAKDFVLDDFDVCSVAASKTCVNDSQDDDAPTAITYNVRGCAINDGGGAINVTSLTNAIGGGAIYDPMPSWYIPAVGFDPSTDCADPIALKTATQTGTPLGDPSSYNLQAGDALVYQFLETTEVNGAQDEVFVDAEGTDGAPIDEASATATCPLRTFDTELTVTKNCQADLESNGSNVLVKINFGGTVCNNGEVALTALILTDSPMADYITLDPGDVHQDPDDTLGVGDCVSYEGYYYPSTIPTGDVCPFMDTVTASAMAPINSAPPQGSETSCVQVSGGFECSATSPGTTCDLRVVDGDNDCSTGLNSDSD